MAEGQLRNVLQHIRKLAALRTVGKGLDCELLERFVTHQDEAAFAALMERHGPLVLSVCRRVLRHVQDAEDACQATFLVLARKAASIRKRDSVASWLHGVAYRVARKLKATAARRRVPESLPVDLPAAETTPETTWREVQVVLDEELQRLPDKYRAPLVLCSLEGKTRDEAAQQLGWTEGTLRGRLERGRERLRARLSRRGLTLSAALLATMLSQSTAATALPASLVGGIVPAASALAAGKATATGLVSPSVAALVEGVVQTMLVAKLKIIVWAALAIGVLSAGAGVLAYQKAVPEAVSEGKAGPPQPPPPRAEATRIVLQDVQQKGQQERLQTLLKARVEVAEAELDARRREFLAGRGILDNLMGASLRLVRAQQELNPNKADQLPTLEAHEKLMKEIFETNKARFNAGRIAPQDFKEAEFYYLEAQIWLERAKAQ